MKFLGKLLGEVERPFVAIIGGAKVSDKIGVLENLLARVDQLLIGGAMANTFLKAKGGKLGRSLVEEDKLALARSFLRKAEQANVDVLLPRDVVAAAGTKSDSGASCRRWRVPEDLAALDIGPETARGFADAIARAKTIFWNGPMGVFESEPFAAGTLAVAKAVAVGARRAVGRRRRRLGRGGPPERRGRQDHATSRPAAARRSSSSRARSCPASPRSRARRIDDGHRRGAHSSAATGS